MGLGKVLILLERMILGNFKPFKVKKNMEVHFKVFKMTLKQPTEEIPYVLKCFKRNVIYSTVPYFKFKIKIYMFSLVNYFKTPVSMEESFKVVLKFLKCDYWKKLTLKQNDSYYMEMIRLFFISRLQPILSCNAIRNETNNNIKFIWNKYGNKTFPIEESK